MKPGETGCLGVVVFRFTNPNLRWIDCAHVWCRSNDPPCSFSSVRSCAFTKPFAIEIVISYVMECPEARMLLIMLITFASWFGSSRTFRQFRKLFIIVTLFLVVCFNDSSYSRLRNAKFRCNWSVAIHYRSFSDFCSFERIIVFSFFIACRVCEIRLA